MKHQLSSGVLLALALEGCGLLVDLPDVGLGNEGGASSGGFEGDGDGDGDGDADGDGDGDLNGDGDLSGDGDGDLMMNSGGLGGAMNLGGAGAGNGGTNTGGAPHTGGSSPDTGGTTSTGGYSGECDSPCDCDGDGALRADQECGGADCDDEDARVFPGQTQFFSAASENENVGFDYDCSEAIERKPGHKVIECNLAIFGSCSDVQGFKDELPACGASGTWGQCIEGTLNCKFSPLETRTATCH